MRRNRVFVAFLAALLMLQMPALAIAEGTPQLQLSAQSHAAFMNGREDGLFHPHDAVTRAETAQMIYTLLVDPPREAADYPDVAATAWYAQPVGVLGRLGLLRADGEGNIRPDDAITRAEFAWLLGAFLPRGVTGAAFSDVSPDHWAAEAISTASAFCMFSGYDDGTFRPDGELTRAQAAAVMCRMLGRTADLEALEAASATVSIFPDVLPDSWAFGPIMEAAVSHVCAAGEDGRETWAQVEARPTVLAEGYHTIDGLLYRVRNGVILRSVTVDGFTFDAAGRYTTGSESLDQRLARIVAENTDSSMSRNEKLRALYNYVRDNYTYLKRPLVDKNAVGWENEYAEDFFNTKRGNCFSYSAAFCLLARQLGLPAYTVVGKLGTRTVQDHGWVEISLDGKTYLFDTELEWSYRNQHHQNRDLFMVDVNDAPFVYSR